MRRKDREMNPDFAWEILEECEYAVLSLVDENQEAYCIPVSAVHQNQTIYIHCALEGKKIDLLSLQKRVCLSAVSRVKRKPFEFSTEYASGIFKGKIALVENEREKIEALRLICEKYAYENMQQFDEAVKKSLNRTAVIKIEADEISAKRKQYDIGGKEMEWGRME